MMERLPPPDLVFVVVLSTIVLPWLVVWRYHHASSGRRPSCSSLKRSFSFTSLASLVGPFPKEAKVTETIINTAIFYDDCPTLQDLENDVIQPMLQYERLAARPEIPSGWSSNNNNSSTSIESTAGLMIEPKDMRRHVIISGNDSLTIETINRHLLDSLEQAETNNRSHHNKNLPWWEFVVIENQGSGKSACLLRMHHGLADGMSLVKVFEKILTDEHGKPITSPLLQHENAHSNKRRVKQPPALSMLWSILCAVLETVALPSSRFDCDILFSRNANGQRTKQMMGSTCTSTSTRTTGTDKNNNSNTGVVVSPILLPPVPLDYIKKLKNAANVTVNDILMTAVSQAIRDYCLDQNCPILVQQQSKNSNNSHRHNKKNVQCRALLPVALPRSKQQQQPGNDDDDDKATALNNSWCMASIDLCLGIDDIEQRLHMIHEKTMAMKSSPAAVVTMWIQNTLGPFLPLSMSRKTLYDTFCRHSLVFSNVPGPSVKCILAGKVVTGIQMFYPNLIPQVGLLSYAGFIHGNIIVMDNNKTLLPKPQLLAKYYAAALIDLGKRLLVDLDEAAASPPKELVMAAAAAPVA